MMAVAWGQHCQQKTPVLVREADAGDDDVSLADAAVEAFFVKEAKFGFGKLNIKILIFVHAEGGDMVVIVGAGVDATHIVVGF